MDGQKVTESEIRGFGEVTFLTLHFDDIKRYVVWFTKYNRSDQYQMNLECWSLGLKSKSQSVMLTSAVTIYMIGEVIKNFIKK